MKLFYKCDLRDPYMGNTIPVTIEVIVKSTRIDVRLTNGEGMSVSAHRIPDPEEKPK